VTLPNWEKDEATGLAAAELGSPQTPHQGGRDTPERRLRDHGRHAEPARRRTVAIDLLTAGALRAHRERHLEEKRVAGCAYDDRDFLYDKPDGSFIHSDIYSQTFRRAVRRLGLPYIRLHDLRHAHATLGLEAGIPAKVMSTRLGHATAAFTQDVYTHSVPSLEECQRRPKIDPLAPGEN
jgi:integrase